MEKTYTENKESNSILASVAIGVLVSAGLGWGYIKHNNTKLLKQVVAVADETYKERKDYLKIETGALENLANNLCHISLRKTSEKAFESCMAAMPSFSGNPNEIVKIEDGNSVKYDLRDLEKKCSYGTALRVGIRENSKCIVSVEDYGAENHGGGGKIVLLTIPSNMAKRYVMAKTHRKM